MGKIVQKKLEKLEKFFRLCQVSQDRSADPEHNILFRPFLWVII